LKVRIKFRKYGVLRYIGHLDVMRYFQKALRRAELPVAFTSGYSPHMIMSFASPLGIGLTSSGEYFDLELTEAVDSAEAVARLNAVGVEGIEVLSLVQIPEDKKSGGMASIAAAEYLISIKENSSLGVETFTPEWDEAIKAFLRQPSVLVNKKTKRSEQVVDILPMIYCLERRPQGIFMRLATGSEQNLKPGLVMQALCEFTGRSYNELDYHTHRVELYGRSPENGQLYTLESAGKTIVWKEN
jgi:radical SAM-linked protein